MERMEKLINGFKTLSEVERLALMKEFTPSIPKIFTNDPQQMMSDMMPFCMNMMKSKGMEMDRMHSMMESMMG